MDSGQLLLGDGVTATFIGGSVCHLVVGENVTLNFSGAYGFFVVLLREEGKEGTEKGKWRRKKGDTNIIMSIGFM
jgi:hypothetical protein